MLFEPDALFEDSLSDDLLFWFSLSLDSDDILFDLPCMSRADSASSNVLSELLLVIITVQSLPVVMMTPSLFIDSSST